HLGIAGEETKGAALRDLQHAPNLFRRLRREEVRTRIGQIGRNVKDRLIRIIVVRWHDQLAGMLNSYAAADVLEAAADGERRRGQHNGFEVFEERLFKDLRDIDWRGLQEDILLT